MDPRPLPPGFISEFDPNTQRYFYVDTSTGTSQWNHPLDAKPPLQPFVEQTSSQYPSQFPSILNPSQQGHYPLGFTSPGLLPSSDQRSTSSFPQPPYPQPTSSDYPSPYPQPRPEHYPQSNYPYGEAQTYVGGSSRTHDTHEQDKDKGIGKVLLGAGGLIGGKHATHGMGKVLLGAGGGLVAGKLAKNKLKKFKGWKGKGWKGKGGWKGWK
ncbi:11636_t:CDS:2 [Funneliformis caledonium]|uniref:11636_t:CDS:1 n=1 Tax=Funneliformis caledonium TaxID=1117310 RepID=A0A9N9BK09_9GLOM|nr:11636_t:CDS:2 [Funneliformis caledonium]